MVVAISVAVAVEVGLINVGVGVCVLVDERLVGVDVSAGIELYAVAVAVSVGWSAATLGGTSIPVNKRAIALIPMKSPIERRVVLARIKMLLIPAINFLKGFPIE